MSKTLAEWMNDGKDVGIKYVRAKAAQNRIDKLLKEGGYESEKKLAEAAAESALGGIAGLFDNERKEEVNTEDTKIEKEIKELQGKIEKIRKANPDIANDIRAGEEIIGNYKGNKEYQEIARAIEGGTIAKPDLTNTTEVSVGDSSAKNAKLVGFYEGAESNASSILQQNFKRHKVEKKYQFERVHDSIANGKEEPVKNDKDENIGTASAKLTNDEFEDLFKEGADGKPNKLYSKLDGIYDEANKDLFDGMANELGIYIEAEELKPYQKKARYFRFLLQYRLGSDKDSTSEQSEFVARIRATKKDKSFTTLFNYLPSADDVKLVGKEIDKKLDAKIVAETARIKADKAKDEEAETTSIAGGDGGAGSGDGKGDEATDSAAAADAKGKIDKTLWAFRNYFDRVGAKEEAELSKLFKDLDETKLPDALKNSIKNQKLIKERSAKIEDLSSKLSEAKTEDEKKKFHQEIAKAEKEKNELFNKQRKKGLQLYDKIVGYSDIAQTKTNSKAFKNDLIGANEDGIMGAEYHGMQGFYNLALQTEKLRSSVNDLGLKDDESLFAFAKVYANPQEKHKDGLLLKNDIGSIIIAEKGVLTQSFVPIGDVEKKMKELSQKSYEALKSDEVILSQITEACKEIKNDEERKQQEEKLFRILAREKASELMQQEIAKARHVAVNDYLSPQEFVDSLPVYFRDKPYKTRFDFSGRKSLQETAYLENMAHVLSPTAIMPGVHISKGANPHVVKINFKMDGLSNLDEMHIYIPGTPQCYINVRVVNGVDEHGRAAYLDRNGKIQYKKCKIGDVIMNECVSHFNGKEYVSVKWGDLEKKAHFGPQGAMIKHHFNMMTIEASASVAASEIKGEGYETRSFAIKTPGKRSSAFGNISLDPVISLVKTPGIGEEPISFKKEFLSAVQIEDLVKKIRSLVVDKKEDEAIKLINEAQWGGKTESYIPCPKLASAEDLSKHDLENVFIRIIPTEDYGQQVQVTGLYEKDGDSFKKIEKPIKRFGAQFINELNKVALNVIVKDEVRSREKDLIDAIRKGDDKTLDKILEEKSTIDNEIGKIDDITGADSNGNVKKALQASSINLSSRDEHGRDALFYAVEAGNEKMIKGLLQVGADAENKYPLYEGGDGKVLVTLSELAERCHGKEFKEKFDAMVATDSKTAVSTISAASHDDGTRSVVSLSLSKKDKPSNSPKYPIAVPLLRERVRVNVGRQG